MTKQRKVEKSYRPSIAFQVLGIILTSVFLLASGVLIWVAACDAEKGEVPDVFGWSACSSNGEYEGVQRDALVLVSLSKGNVNYQQGNVVAFYYPNAATTTKIYLGSVLSLGEQGQATLYINEKLPELNVDQGLILGRAEYYIADVGYFLAILEGGYGLILAISILVLFVAILIMFIGNIALKRRYALEDAQLGKELDVQEEILVQKRQEVERLVRPEHQEPTPSEDGAAVLDFVEKPERLSSEAGGALEAADAEKATAESPLAYEARVSGAADSNFAQITLKVEHQQGELLKKLIKLAMQQKKVEDAQVELLEGQPCTLHVVCGWKDVPIVSAILVEVQKRKEQK